MKVLVTGATGYVGSRLVTELLTAGHDVRVAARNLDHARRRPWADRVELVEADVHDARTTTTALTGVDTALYLVHAMGHAHGLLGRRRFVELERQAARTFAGAAELVGVRHVIYLGGLVDEGQAKLSDHLASRIATGAILADVGPAVTELRASIVLGAGSASFELVRLASMTSLAVPVPGWARHDCQPIAVGDLLAMLVDTVADGPTAQHAVVEVAGPDAVAYHELVHTHRRVTERFPVPTVPIVLPRAVAVRVASLVTPLPGGLVGPLVESLAFDTVLTGNNASRIGATGIDEAMLLAHRQTGPASTMAGDPWWVDATLPETIVRGTVETLGLRTLLDRVA